MAKRRMFSLDIVDSDAFLDMPLSAQGLYYQLCMRADDEGFINNSKKIQRMIGASEQDLKDLINNRFILSFNSGVVVIKHWYIHNFVPKDRFKATLYQEEKALLRIKENKSYTWITKPNTSCIQSVNNPTTNCIHNDDSLETKCIQDADDKQDDLQQKAAGNRINTDDNNLYTECIQNDNKVYTQDRIDKDRLGKDRLGKDRIDKIEQNKIISIDQKKSLSSEIINQWNELTVYGVPEVYSLDPKRIDKLQSCLAKYGTDKFAKLVAEIKKSDYLLGNTENGKPVSFDWAIDINNFGRIIEGVYKTIEKTKKGGRNFLPEEHTPEYFSNLEKQILDN